MEVSKERAEVLRKREELKKKLSCVRAEYAEAKFETRSKTEVETELRTLIEEVKSIDAELETNEAKESAEIKEAEVKEVLTDERSTKNMNMTRDQLAASPEYREAFLRHLQGTSTPEMRTTYFDSSVTQAVIPLVTADKIFETLVKTAPMLNEITLLRIAGNVRLAVEGTRAAAAQHTENAAATPASDTLTYVDLAGYEYIKVQRISATVRTLAVPAFENWLVKVLAEDIARKLENDIINANGSGAPKGIEYARTWTNASTGIDFGTAVTYDNIVDLIALLNASYDANAKFLTSKSFLYGKLAKVKDAEGNPLLVRDFSNGLQMRLMGYPVLISDYVAADTMYLGDFTTVVGNLAQDITIESSAQSAFTSNAIDYRGVALFDQDIPVPAALVKLFT